MDSPEVVLRGCFSNPRKSVGPLISRIRKGSRPHGPRSQTIERVVQRGPVIEESRRSRTHLNASNRAALLAAYSEGVPLKELTARFGVHRATINELV